MATDKEWGEVEIRSQFFDKTVKGFAERLYKFKQSLTMAKTAAWKNFFYREKATALTAKGNRNIGGLARGAAFPQAVVEWDRIETQIRKYGLEDTIPWEDTLSDDIDVRNRTLFRIAEGVAKAVDDQIWADLGGDVDVAGNGADTQNKLTSSFSVVGKAWTHSSAAIIDDLMHAKQLIEENNYDTTNLECWVSPRDFRSIMRYITDSGAQFPSFSTDIAKNGRAGKLAGVQLVVSNSVTASNAVVIVPKRCATWKELFPLTTATMEDKFKGTTVRAAELGVTELTDPKTVVRIMGTQANV